MRRIPFVADKLNTVNTSNTADVNDSSVDIMDVAARLGTKTTVMAWEQVATKWGTSIWMKPCHGFHYSYFFHFKEREKSCGTHHKIK